MSHGKEKNHKQHKREDQKNIWVDIQDKTMAGHGVGAHLNPVFLFFFSPVRKKIEHTVRVILSHMILNQIGEK